MRLGLDGRSFESPAAGVRRYVAGLVTALLGLDDAPDIVALGGSASAVPPRVTHVPESRHPPTNAGWVLVGLPRTARRANVDLIHSPAYTAPMWAGAPVVVTIHDVSYARHPEWYPYRRDMLRRLFYRWSALAAAQIVTVSTFSADEIVAAYGIERRRITVVPLGVNAGFAPADESASPMTFERPYLLHVGDLHERRNLGIVVEALADARQRPGARDLILVVAGQDRGSLAGLRHVATRLGIPDAIVHMEAVDEERLRTLYHGATALVYPSRYEGFGLPVLEAMASGTPVIASNAASIPEVLGDAGLLLDPDDASGWAAALAEIVTDPARRIRMRAAGLRRAAHFTWDRTARQTLDVYRRALDG